MNDEAIFNALMANIGDPQVLVAQSQNIELPSMSKRALNTVKRKFVLLGKAAFAQSVLDFVTRLKQTVDSTKEQQSQKAQAEKMQQGQMDESQFKGPSGKHTRSQSMFRQSISPSMSFGGVKDVGGKQKKKSTAKEDLEARIASILNEDVTIRADGAALLVDRGEFVVDGEVVIRNHADILKLAITWLMDNYPEVAQAAVDGVADMARNGAIFR